MAATTRFILVLGIIVLVVAMLAIAAIAYGIVSGPVPSSCADSSMPSSLAPAECRRSITIYIVAIVACGAGVAALWRRLGR
jgi:hypothetical protein